MSEAWLTALGQGVFWIVAMTLTMRWLARSRQRPRSPAQANRLAHPPAILVTGIVTTVLFGGVTLATLIWPDQDMPLLGTLYFASFVLLSGTMIADYYFARHELTDAGMDFGHMSGKRVSFRWTEVRRVRFSRAMNWFRIELQSGHVVRVSAFMMGLPVFAACVLREVPAVHIDQDTLVLLEKTAKGDLPSIWR